MIQADRKNFDELVLEATGPVLVDFYGDGCAPCAALMPHLEKFAEQYGEQLKFVGLNTSKARRVAIAQRVMGLPVVAIYQDGKKVEELVKEAATPVAIEEMIKRYL